MHFDSLPHLKQMNVAAAPVSVGEYKPGWLGSVLGAIPTGLYLFVALILLFGVCAIAFASASNKGTSLAQRKAKAAAAAKAPVTVEPKSAAPMLATRSAPAIVKAERKPVMQPKSVVAPAPVAPAVVVAAPAPVAAAPEPVAAPTVARAASTGGLESTFEKYRQAMLSTGPRRQMEENGRGEIQIKNSHANSAHWREQTSALRENLKDEAVEDYLERNNLSINDRVVGMFNAMKA
jgi:hypothetical protein